MTVTRLARLAGDPCLRALRAPSIRTGSPVRDADAWSTPRGPAIAGLLPSTASGDEPRRPAQAIASALRLRVRRLGDAIPYPVRPALELLP